MRRTSLLACCLWLAALTAAQAQNLNTIDTIVSTFQTTTNGWEAGLQQFAQNTFFGLATIQLFWSMGRLALKRPDFSEILAELVNQILFIGLFYWLLTTTPTWGPAIINGFRRAGGSAAGVSVLTPGDVFKVGINIAGQIWAQITVWDPGASVGLVISALVVLACFAWIVLTMVVALVESYFVISGGVLLMAFGASMWTKDVAIGVVRNVFGIGAKLFALQLVTAVGGTFVQTWSQQQLGGTFTAQALFISICQALVLAGIVKTIPDLFQRMVGGIGTGNAGALIGAAAGLAAATTTLASVTAKLATSIAGAGVAAGRAAQLASTQFAASGAQSAGGLDRAAQIVGQAAKNLASGAATDIGRRLSGQGSPRGSAGFRIAADLQERAQLINEQSNAPKPPSTP